MFKTLDTHYSVVITGSFEYEPRHEKTGFVHMRKQSRRSATW